MTPILYILFLLCPHPISDEQTVDAELIGCDNSYIEVDSTGQSWVISPPCNYIYFTCDFCGKNVKRMEKEHRRKVESDVVYVIDEGKGFQWGVDE